MESNSCKHLGVMISKDLNWVNEVSEVTSKLWSALHVMNRVLEKSKKKKTIIRPVLEEYGVMCWDAYKNEHSLLLDKIRKWAEKMFG